MVRYSPGHKEETRQRLVEAAGRRFKVDGIDGSGIATLVADAGLTNGAFYGHFTSKDDLVSAVVRDQMTQQAARIDALPPGRTSAELIIREYLSAGHRNDVAGGCPSAALADELARCDIAIRQEFTEGAQRIVSALARHLPQNSASSAELRATSLFALLVASLQFARAVTDPQWSDRILETAYANALTIAGLSELASTHTEQEQR